MAYFTSIFLLVLAIMGTVEARFDPSAQDNVATYWGQAPTQEGLAYYCKNNQIDIIPLAFLNYIVNPTNIHFTNVENRCTKFAGTTVFNCPEVEADIKSCQSQNKTILLSIGGSAYSEGGFPTADMAVTAAEKVWAMFGPPGDSSPTIYRPFGSASVDGFDLDFETTQAANLLPFARRLRQLIDAANSKNPRKLYFTAAPQCVYPDLPMDAILSSSTAFDFVMVQFYNNRCGADAFDVGNATQAAFNFATWDTWANANSRKTKVLVGVPGTPAAAGTGYVNATMVKAIVDYSKKYSSFAGVMVWDVAQALANKGFLESIGKSLDRGVKRDKATATPTTNMPAGAVETGEAAAETPQAPRKNAAGQSAVGMSWGGYVVFSLVIAYLAC